MELAEINQKIKNIKKENLKYELREEAAKTDPFEQFLIWFDFALEHANADPSAMILATVDERGFPDTRMVLLKELEYQRYIFYTSYSSKKARDLAHLNVAALNFYWPDLYCQVRMRGRVEKLDRQKSELYFSSRPRESQLSAHAWSQSSILSSRNELENRIKVQEERFSDQKIFCPEDWGGYAFVPFEYEFFQRRQWRRHDRLFYSLSEKTWKMVRLAP